MRRLHQAEVVPVRLTGKAQVAGDVCQLTQKGTMTLLKRLCASVLNQTARDSGMQRNSILGRGVTMRNAWVRCLADKVFPTLEEDARELLAVDRYLSNITDPSIALAVRQKRPETMEEAVAATLEMESYSTQCVKEKKKKVSFVEEVTEHDVGMVRSQQNVIALLEAIVSRLEKLESADDAREHGHEKGNSSFSRGKKQGKERTQSVRCFKCGQEGHYARGCASKGGKPQGN